MTDDIVLCFDRDNTVDCSAGPVPLDWIRRLAESYPVVAVGNQTLCREADIPGVGSLDDPDHVERNVRAQRLRQVQATHPDADLYVHVDDVDVGAGGWERWVYFTPSEFVSAVEAGEIPGLDTLI